ncbi:MAG TPA: AmmeMemoRadiSam system protein B [Bacteroidales bacterium]|nr:AmmeMemoRadiSam system protein B [Bacteroidales bacterium]
MKTGICILLISIQALTGWTVSGQPATGMGDREPAVAGSFYPDDATDLSNMLAGFFTQTRRLDDPGSPQPLALVAPHAGYVFSGQVAAWSYAQLDPDKHYANIFIIGTSHYKHFDGVSIYNAGNYITPLGEAEVNKKIANDLISKSAMIRFVPSAHQKEHSIEVQLPFLLFHLHEPFKIVPVLLGTSDPEVISGLYQLLEPYKTAENLFILSTDFSHYPAYAEANITDSLTARAFMSHDPGFFRSYVVRTEKKPEKGLITPLCGWPSALVIMHLFQDPDKYLYRTVFHQNSGDTKFGDKSRVVGYYSIMITPKTAVMEDTDSNLTNSEKIHLLKIARESLEHYLRTGRFLDYDENVLPDVFLEHRGAFVTLHKGRALRGCIGRFLPNEPLYKVVQQMAVAAAIKDQRFKPVVYGELNQISIEISVLSPLKEINSADDIILGKDGILIRKGNVSGTYLPQVATETGWSKEEFLGHCSRDKAGLGWDGWKDAELFVYTADIFSEKEVRK